MAGANWTRKDYVAVADLIAREIKIMDMRTFQAKKICSLAIDECFKNSKLTINGIPNFDAEKFREYVQKKSGVSFYPR